MKQSESEPAVKQLKKKVFKKNAKPKPFNVFLQELMFEKSNSIIKENND